MKTLLLFLFIFSTPSFAVVTIDLYGDSTQAGAELVDGRYITTQSPPSAILQSRMDERFGAGAVIVRNKGIGGSTIAQQYWGQPPFTRSWEAEMATSDANIVVDNHGINDAFIPYMTGADYVWCHNMMSSAAQAHGKKYFIETPNPINNPANTKLASFLSALYAGPVFVGTMFVYINRVELIDWEYWKQRLPDGIHPNAEMYRYTGDRLFYTLEPVVKPMLGL